MTSQETYSITKLLQQGDALRISGKPSQAVNYYHTAFLKDDKNTDTLIRLGSTLLQLGQPAKAIQYLELGYLADQNNKKLNELLHSTYRFICEASINGKASNQRMHKSAHQALSAICNVFNKLEKHSISCDVLTQLLETYSNSYILHEKLGRVLRVKGDMQRAIAHFKKSISLEPNYSASSAGLAQVYERIGETNKGLQAISTFLDNDPVDPAISLIYAKLCLQNKNPDKGLQVIEKALTHSALSKPNDILLSFQAGKISNTIKEYDRAFAYYQKANELKAKDFNREALSNTIDQIANRYTRASLDKMPHLDNNPARPIFIVGLPRSGTSLTEQMLASHPEVSAAGESEALQIVENQYLDNTAINLQTLSDSYYRELALSKKNEYRSTDKMLSNYKRLHLIEMLFPKARIIHVTRNPLDCCLSIYFSNFSASHRYANKLEDIAVYSNEYNRMMRHWHNVIRLPIFTLSYEQLVANHEETLRKLLSFCQLEWNDSCLNFFDSKNYMNTTSYDQVRKPIYTQSIQRWRHYEKHLQPLIQTLDDLGDIVATNN